MKTAEQLLEEARQLIELLECKCDTASLGGYECPRCKWLTERWAAYGPPPRGGS